MSRTSSSETTPWDMLLPVQLSDAARSFRFQSGETFLCRLQDAAGACLVYFLVVELLKHWMKNRKGFDLRSIIVVHNAFLTITSTVLFSGFVLVLVEKAGTFSPYEMICSLKFHDDGRLQFLYYLNYLVKWYELLDTVILVLKKREVIFLHEYHHAATLALTWIQMDQHSTVQWVPITINLLVHMFMYYYFMLAALKINVWWKKYLTQLQIVQFVIDIAACVYASWHEPVLGGLGLSIYFPDAAWCNGTLIGAVSGVGIIFSYLLLFLVFYFNTYRANEKKPRSKKDQ